MIKKNNSHKIFSTSNVYNTFFSQGKCFVSTSVNVPDLYYLDSIAQENDKIIIVDAIQEQ